MKYIVLLGRVLYSYIFITSVLGHFSRHTIEYVASKGLPMATILVPLAGAMALVGGISILVGWNARWGAWLLVLFLLPVTITMHRFWGIADPMAAGMQKIMFLKNILKNLLYQKF